MHKLLRHLLLRHWLLLAAVLALLHLVFRLHLS